MFTKFYVSKPRAVVLSLALLTTLSVAGGFAPARAVLIDDAARVTMNSIVTDFTLSDADGKERKLSTLRGKQATAIIFVSTRCPVSNGYNSRMAQLAADYEAKGVSVIGINANNGETPEQIKTHAAENKLAFTILKDKNNKVADRFGAQFTPEVFLLDGAGKLVYHGRIDNSRDPEAVNAPDLRNAIDAVLAGQAVPVAETKAFGCSIKRVA